ncbi:MAG TPA: hypothetical protein DEG71_07065 [Clostridiales bacterium]|nr:hypothetical protein [Clostridiales bacterium]
MERTFKLERLYPLGQYVNIKLCDEVTNLPEEVLFNVELSSKVRYLQMLEVEIAYRNYINLMKIAETKSAEEVAQYLEEQRIETVKEIAAEFENKTLDK